MSSYHIPVLLSKVLDSLNIKPNQWYIDCNLGGGGHTEGIIRAGGKVLGLDLDHEAILEVARSHNLKLEKDGEALFAKTHNLVIYQANFSEISRIAQKFHVQPNGILFDLGVSTFQLEQSSKGFSFNRDAPLDMRMNQNLSISAQELVNGLYEKELAAVFWKYGEESFSKPIAKKIVEYRKNQKIETTGELVKIILSVKRRISNHRIHPATKIFQALRIAVNDELNSLTKSLPQAVKILQPGGRLAIISFHSLEDRIVKNYFKNEQQNSSIKIITQKPLGPEAEEVATNPRSRSSKLRIIEKI